VITRRTVLAWAAGSLIASGRDIPPVLAATYPVTLTDGQWRAKLSADQYAVLRQHATEPPFTSPLLKEHRHGDFLCIGCEQPLFSSTTKFESGTGWPSFWKPLTGAVATSRDTSDGMVRSEVHCSRCGGHLGHVFNDGPPPTGLRYCINGLALTFRPTEA
jgi:peptide-methionine (R)-S-oxide reductase